MKAKPIDFKILSYELEKRKNDNHKLGFLGAYVSRSGKGSPCVKIKLLDEIYILSRVIWCVHNSKSIPDGMIIDHLDGDPLNNNPENLRIASFKTNNWNKKMQRNNKTGITGVCFIERSNSWAVSFGRMNSRRKWFNNLFDAACFRKSLENEGIRITERHGS